MPQHEVGFCRLVDTSALNDTTQKELQYVAVSHTWGAPGPRFFCRKENIARLKDKFFTEELPATLRDAVDIVRRLGLHYLWIDALCMIYDSTEDLQAEMGMLEDIFSESYCAIAATSADVMASGFLQPRQETKIAFVGEAAEGSGSIYVSNLVNNSEVDVLHTRLHNRAWTLQERALARRTIFFAKNQTYFRCEALTKLQRLVVSLFHYQHS